MEKGCVGASGTKVFSHMAFHGGSEHGCSDERFGKARLRSRLRVQQKTVPGPHMDTEPAVTEIRGGGQRTSGQDLKWFLVIFRGFLRLVEAVCSLSAHASVGH